MDYRFGDKRKTLALRVYPAISLAHARQRREDAPRLLANETDPGELERASKLTQGEAAALVAETFEALAREWLAKREANGDTA